MVGGSPEERGRAKDGVRLSVRVWKMSGGSRDYIRWEILVKKPPELRNIVTMADLIESFDDASEKITEEILQQGEIMMYEEEEEDKDP